LQHRTEVDRILPPCLFKHHRAKIEGFVGFVEGACYEVSKRRSKNKRICGSVVRPPIVISPLPRCCTIFTLFLGTKLFLL
jgi:hypothetical protein